MTRFAREKQVIFWEEPIINDKIKPYIMVKGLNPMIVTPVIKRYCNNVLRNLLKNFLYSRDIRHPDISWYYTPMMLGFTDEISAKCIVYDCMDELSLFKNAPEHLLEREEILLEKADLVFTGGHSLYLEKQKKRHRHIFPFPSSVDKEHFKQALGSLETFSDQKHLPWPRIGYSGVLDERLDYELIEKVAKQRPNYQFIFIGPVVKVNKEDLPKASNIHYLGQKSYNDLPHYMSSWNVAWMPFALNNATKFISPTKTPEYLAAERPVVSTAVPDVVYGYSNLDCVFIGDENNIPELLDKAMGCLCWDAERKLASMSWDKTFGKMSGLIDKVLKK
jgi:UDP-galactopyranose mutase